MKNKSIMIAVLFISWIITGCFDRYTEYNMKLQSNKNIKGLLPGEEFYISAVKVSGKKPKDISIKYNNKTIKTNQDTKVMFIAEKGTDQNIYLYSGREEIGKAETNTSKIKRKKSIYVYMAADNDMTFQALADLEEMRAGSENRDIIYFIYLDRLEGDLDNVYIVIENGVDRTITYDVEKNTGDTRTFVEFLKYADTCIESEEKSLLLWNHGDGWLGDGNEIFAPKRMIGYDYTKNDGLSLIELQSGLIQTNIKFNMIMFDACLMGGIETLDCISQFSDYIIASPEVTPYDGFDYSKISEILNKNTDIQEKSIEIVRNTADSFMGKEFSIFVAYDSKKIYELEKTVNILAEKLIENREKVKNVKGDFANEILSYSSVGEDYSKYTDYADLKDFCKFLKKRNIAVDETQMVDRALSECVTAISYTVGFDILGFERSGGLNIYLPNTKYDNSYEYVSTFGKNSKWTYFVAELNK